MSETGEHKERRRAVSRATARLTVPQSEAAENTGTIYHAKQGGVIRGGAVESHLSSRLNEIEDRATAVEPTKIVIAIVVVSLIFIAIVTWLIASMPAK